MLDPVERILAEDAHFSEWLVDHAGKDFSIVCDRSLANFLWIANVQGSRLFKLVLWRATFFDNLGDLFAANRNLTTHGVLSLDDIFAQTVEDRLVIAAWYSAIK